MFENLFKPAKIGNLEIKNRFVVPAMGTGHEEKDDTVGEELIEFFAARARGGFGLLITDNTYVDRSGRASDPQLAIDSDKYISGYRKLTERVHQEGSKIFIQLSHGGRETSSNYTGMQLVAPSPIACPVMREVPRELSTKEVYSIIEKFGDGALRAKKAGFDGVELHGAHGYLIGEFMSSYTNKRTDEFGGDILSRVKFPIKIIQNIKEKCGKDFPVCMRISADERVSDGMHVSEAVIIAKMLEKNGLDVINVSTGVYASMPYNIAPYYVKGGFLSECSREIKNAVTIPVIVVGRINDPLVADSIIESGSADFVALGRASIADCEFPNKVKENRTNEIIPCVGCLSRCTGVISGNIPGDYAGSCMLNPFSGHELTLKIEKAEKIKNIVIVGAGVAGMEAAWISAARGHKVTILEKTDRAGGQVVYASMPPFKSELTRAIRYFKTMCEKYGVEIRYNTEATTDTIMEMQPDAVILATGAKPIWIDFPNKGIEISQAVEVLMGEAEIGENNLIIGGGLVGLETAEFIVSQKRKATVIEMMDKAGADMDESIQYFIFKELEKGNVQIKTGTKVESFTMDGAVCSNREGQHTLKDYDKVILAIGAKSFNPLENELIEKVPELYVIGDAVKPRRIANVVEEGARIAVEI